MDHDPEAPPERFLLRGEALGEVISGLGQGIDLSAWQHKDAAHLLRGCEWLKSRVALVRDAVVGRARAREVLEVVEEGDAPVEQGWDRPTTSVITRTSGAELVAELERRGVGLTQIGTVFEPTTREETTTWQAEDAVELAKVWHELVAAGFFLDRRSKRVAWGDSEGFVDLQLAA